MSVMNKKLLHRDVFLGTVFAFGILFLIKLIFFNTHYLDPITQPLSDFQFTDLYYSQITKQKTEIDTNIVLVNIGENDRLGILQQLEIIKSNAPKVIGLDVTFKEKKDPLIDSALRVALNGEIPVILTSNLIYEKNNEGHGSFSEVECSHDCFEKDNDQGYGNFLAQEGHTVRYYAPLIKQENDTLFALTTKIIKLFNPKDYDNLLSRNKKTEIINYQSDVFVKYDVFDIYPSADLSFLKDKIVMMGYMGPSFSQVVMEDNHLTPLNKSYGGHALPDKYGVEIHANIISMVLNNNYIDEIPSWLTYFLAFIVCMLHMYFFIYLFVKQHKWFHLGVKITQLVSFGIIVFISLLIYGAFQIKLEPSYIIIGVLLSGDALYFYEAFILLINKKIHFNSLFLNHH